VPVNPGTIDFGLTADDYGRHRAGFPPSLFERLAPLGVGLRGQRALDLGTGTGTLARGLALRGCDVVGLDRSPSLLAEARRLDGERGVTVAYLVAAAEAIALDGARFDVVTAGQCWHWFDRPRAAREVRRVLRPGGRLAICYFDWVNLDGNVAEATEALVGRHNPKWFAWMKASFLGNGLYPEWLRDVGEAGFASIETFSYDVTVDYSHAAWRGRIRACAGVGASLPPDGVARVDEELAALLATRFPVEPLTVPHRVFAIVCRSG
jgi:SAM-dependent methyltransferase